MNRQMDKQTGCSTHRACMQCVTLNKRNLTLSLSYAYKQIPYKTYV